MTSIAPYKIFHCICVSSYREVPGRRDWLASTVKVPPSRVPSNLKNFFALWVPVLVVEPRVSSFFCLKNSGSQTFTMHPNPPKGLLNHRCPVSDSLHLAICISSKLPGEAIALLWELQARNHLLSNQPDLLNTKLNWPWQLGIRLLQHSSLPLPVLLYQQLILTH